MKVKVWIERGDSRKSMNIPEDSSVEDLLRELEMNPESVIAMVNGEVVMEDEPLEEGDKVDLRAVKIPG